MKELLNAEQAKALDYYSTESFGMRSLVLMERAAYEVAACIKGLSAGRRRVFCLAGTGNNGADGLAAMRILYEAGYSVSVLAVGKPEKATEEWICQRDLLNRLGIGVPFAGKDPVIRETYDFYVDALFGVGLKREITGCFRQALEAFRKAARMAEGTVVAVDICSGVDASTGKILGIAVQADVTVTFGCEKLGQYLYPGAACSKKLLTVPIGLAPLRTADIGPTAQLVGPEDAASMLKARNPAGNKGTFGRVFVLAGSENMAGACCFCAQAAYRVGAGLVSAAVPEANRVILQTTMPEAVLSVYKEKWDREEMLSQMGKAKAIVVGPGLGQSRQAGEILDFILAQHGERPMVLDADGLNLLAKKEPYPLGRNLILTPHPGEMSRLLSCTSEQREELGQQELARLLSEKWGCTVVCKDARTLIRTTGGKVYFSSSGNDGMATGGSGDILAGMIGGLLAQGYPAEEAAVLGVFLHGLAGDCAAETAGRRGMTARDILDAVPQAVRTVELLQKERGSVPENEWRAI